MEKKEEKEIHKCIWCDKELEDDEETTCEKCSEKIEDLSSMDRCLYN